MNIRTSRRQNIGPEIFIALSRRFAGKSDIEYDDLRPVADLSTHLQESISSWLDNPNDWKDESNEDERSDSLQAMRRAVFDKLLVLAIEHIDKYTNKWQAAYQYKGMRIKL